MLATAGCAEDRAAFVALHNPIAATNVFALRALRVLTHRCCSTSSGSDARSGLPFPRKVVAHERSPNEFAAVTHRTSINRTVSTSLASTFKHHWCRQMSVDAFHHRTSLGIDASRHPYSFADHVQRKCSPAAGRHVLFPCSTALATSTRAVTCETHRTREFVHCATTALTAAGAVARRATGDSNRFAVR